MKCTQLTHILGILIPIFGLIYPGDSAVVQHSHLSDLHKEREADGAYSPRDKEHFSDGEHHIEFDHEAILGSHQKAEEFDHLPASESKRRLRLLLPNIDLTNDHMIDRKELKAWIMRSFKMLTEEEARDALEDADEDKDGLVTWNEHLLEKYGFDDSSQESIKIYSGLQKELAVADDRELWEAADVNGDGSLDSNEWVPFSHPEEDPRMLPIILKHNMRNKDMDGDGAVDFQEFVGKEAKKHDKKWLESEKLNFDHSYDKDGDGKLTGNELLSWLVPSNEEIAEEEVNHLFAAADDDHDDLLSFDEIESHHDTFVGSEATDFGDHLHNIERFTDEL